MREKARSPFNAILRGAAVAAAVLCGVLLSTPAQAYRTAGDLPEFEGTERVRWASGIANFVLVDDVPGGSGTVATNAELIRAALRAWTSTECTALQAGFAGLTSSEAVYGDGTNSVRWVRSGWEDYGFRPGAAGATDIRYELQDDEWVIVEADVYLNAQDHDWTTGTGTDDEREIVGVLTHELGHALGLLHPCEEDGEPMCSEEMIEEPVTMHAAYSHGQLTLKQDDIDGICFLYPACTGESCAKGEVCTPQGCAVECSDMTCAVGETCVNGACFDPLDPCQTGSPECRDCRTDQQCGFGFACVEGECVNATVPIGDPCETADNCPSGVCSEAGYCGHFCVVDDQCGDEGVCDLEEYVCSTDLRQPLGGACASASDCLGERCIADLTDEPVCTRPCDPEGTPCPFDWSCEDVDDELVCAPPVRVQREKGCGCRVVGARAHAPSSTPVALLGALLTAFFWRRRRVARPIRN